MGHAANINKTRGFDRRGEEGAISSILRKTGEQRWKNGYKGENIQSQ